MRKKILISALTLVVLAASYIVFTSLKPESKAPKQVIEEEITINDKLTAMGFAGFPTKDDIAKREKYEALGLKFVTQNEIAREIHSHGVDMFSRNLWTTYPANKYRGEIPEAIRLLIVKNYELIKQDIPEDNKTVRIMGPVDKGIPDPIAYVSIKGGGYVFLAEWE